MIKNILAVILSMLILMPFVIADFSITNQAADYGKVSQGSKITEKVAITNGGAENTLTFPSTLKFTGPAEVSASISFSGSNSLSAGQSREYNYEITLPSSVSNGAYSGTITITDKDGISRSQAVSFSVDMPVSIQFPESLGFGEVYHNQTKSKEFTIRNTGSSIARNVVLSSNADSKFKIEFEPRTISSMNPGESKTIKANIYVPYEEKAEKNHAMGSLGVRADGFGSSAENFFRADVKGYLEINSVRFRFGNEEDSVSSSTEKLDKKTEPAEKVRIDIEVENSWRRVADQDLDIEDVEANIFIEGLEEDDENIDYTSDAVTLDPDGSGKTHTFTYEFDIPTSAEDREYPMEIKVTGRDEDGNDYEEVWFIDVGIERISHNLRITSFALSPTSVECSSSFLANFEVSNLGKEDEDYVRYTLKNAALGIDESESLLEILADSSNDEDYTYRKNMRLVSNNKAGNYPMELKVYRDFDVLEDIRTINLAVKECNSGNIAVKEEVKEEPMKETVKVNTTSNVAAPPKKEEAPKTQKKILPLLESPENQPVIIGRVSTTEPDPAYLLMALGVLIIIALAAVLALAFSGKAR